jgi:hypothetical protein
MATIVTNFQPIEEKGITTDFKPSNNEVDVMKNIPPLTPEQELAPAPPPERGSPYGEITALPPYGKVKIGPVELSSRMIGESIPFLKNITGERPWRSPETAMEAVPFAAGGLIGGARRALGEVAPKAISPTTQPTGLRPTELPPPKLSDLSISGGKKATPQKLLEKVGGEMKPSLAGESAKENMIIGLEEAKTRGGQLYGDAARLIGSDTKLNYDNLPKLIDKIKESDYYQLLTEPEQQYVNKLMDMVNRKVSPEVRSGMRPRGAPLSEELQAEIRGQIGDITTPGTFTQAEGLRRTIAEQQASIFKKGNWNLYNVIKDFNKGFEDIMEAGAKKAGKPEGWKAWKEARTNWAEDVVPREGKLFEKLKEISPEVFVHKMNTGTTKDVKAILDLVGPEGRDRLKQGWVTDLLHRNENNPIKVAKEARKLLANKREQLSLFLNEDEMGMLHEIGDPSKLKVFLENHPNARAMAQHFLRYGLFYAGGYTIIRHFLPMPWEHK